MDKGNGKSAPRKLQRRKTVKKDLGAKLKALPETPPSPPLPGRRSQHGLHQREPNSKAAVFLPDQQSTDMDTADLPPIPLSQ